MRIFLLLLFGMTFSIFLSCTSDEFPQNPCVVDQLDHGILIVNEGPFNIGSGTLTAIDDNSGLIESIFQQNNCDEELGNIVQSILIHGDKIFIVVNNADKIEIVDNKTFESLGTIEGLSLPRYLTPGENNMIYLSQWGADGLNGSILEIDANTLEPGRMLMVRKGPEEILFHDGLLYVPHVGGLDRDSVLFILDVDSWSVQKEIVVGDNPQSLVRAGSNIWCLSTGHWDGATPGALTKISNGNSVRSIPLSNGAQNLVFQPNLGLLYWHTYTSIQKIALQGDEPEEFLSGFFYDLAFDSETNQIYACDAVDFSSPGKVLRIEASTGIVLDSIQAGVSPGEVYFY